LSIYYPCLLSLLLSSSYSLSISSLTKLSSYIIKLIIYIIHIHTHTHHHQQLHHHYYSSKYSFFLISSNNTVQNNNEKSEENEEENQDEEAGELYHFIVIVSHHSSINSAYFESIVVLPYFQLLFIFEFEIKIGTSLINHSSVSPQKFHDVSLHL